MILARKRRRGALTIALMCFVVGSAYALDTNRSLAQYTRAYWGAESGFRGGAVNAIAQTSDGYLWVGTDTGLFRFDGFSFVQVSFSPMVEASKVPILSLLTDASGNLWLRPQGSDVLRQDKGAFETVRYGAGPLSANVTAISKDRNGAILVSDVVEGTIRFGGRTPQKLALPNMVPGSSPVISIAQTSEGNIWLGTLGAGLFRLVDGRVVAANAGLPERKINCLVAVSKDDLWAGTDNGLYHWNGKDFRREALPLSLDNVQVLSLLRDRDSNLWVGTARGLLRINAKGASFSDEKELRGNGGINVLFEDREGNVWVGGARGLGRIRDTVFVTYSAATDPRFENTGPIYVDAKGRTWFAPGQGGLYTLNDNHVQRVSKVVPANEVVYSIAGAGDGVWLARQRGGLTHLWVRNGTITSRTYTKADGLAQDSVYSVLQSRDGSVWAGTLSGGVSRLQDGRFTTYTAANGLGANTISSIVEGRNGTMWFATPAGVSSLSNRQWRTYTRSDGLPSAQVNCLFVDSSGMLWSGTSDGLAFFVSGTFKVPSSPELLREPIFGIAEDRNGWFWITTANHVLQVARGKLLEGKVNARDVREYGPADGLPSSEGINRSTSVFRDSGGRIWLSVKGGLSVVDPSHLITSWPAAIPHIEAVTADGIVLHPTDSLRVPARRKRITFSYTALSLAVPERIRFRYFLEGFDRQWSEPSASRETTYTNLGPGTYRFHVVASNSYGEWNGSETSVTCEIEAAFWQTWWFRSFLVLMVAFVALVLYRFHLNRVTHELNMRFEERLAERTRIAQDLHDTLLQGFISACMQLHVADDKLAADSPAKTLITRVLELMDQVIHEGRNAVRGLRSTNDETHDLGQAFSRVPQELGCPEELEFRVVVEGEPQLLHPVIRDEVYRIGRESMVNAFRHSRASKVEVEIEYTTRDLRILVRDNGCGIDPEVLRAGRNDHWGLPGMRERAEKIGATLTVWSRATAGTEVELSVPAHIAFQLHGSPGSLKWLARLYPRSVAHEIEKPESKRRA